MISTKLARFSVVGGLGFLVDASVLTVLVKLAGFGLYSSRAVSFLLAVSVTWLANRFWTFGTAGHQRRGREYAGYIVVQVLGALINLGVYVYCIESFAWMGRYPVVPLAIGAALALVFNFYFSNRLVFRHGSTR